MNNKYIKYGYLVITLLISAWIHIGAETFIEFIGITILTALLFAAIYFCIKSFSNGNLGIKVLKVIGIIACLIMIWISCMYASVRQFNSYACKPNLIGQNIFNKNKQTYCNFIPWYAKAYTQDEAIQKLLMSWKGTQSKFSVKAGESGTYNFPDKIQFISADTMLVHYDDGLVDHISVIQFKNNSFVELKNVGVMSTMSEAEWKALVNTYGSADYQVSNYQTSDSGAFTKVSSNVFVR